VAGVGPQNPQHLSVIMPRPKGFLGGRLTLRQPRRGYRAGMDAAPAGRRLRCGPRPEGDRGRLRRGRRPAQRRPATARTACSPGSSATPRPWPCQGQYRAQRPGAPVGVVLGRCGPEAGGARSRAVRRGLANPRSSTIPPPSAARRGGSARAPGSRRRLQAWTRFLLKAVAGGRDDHPGPPRRPPGRHPGLAGLWRRLVPHSAGAAVRR